MTPSASSIPRKSSAHGTGAGRSSYKTSPSPSVTDRVEIITSSTPSAAAITSSRSPRRPSPGLISCRFYTLIAPTSRRPGEALPSQPLPPTNIGRNRGFFSSTIVSASPPDRPGISLFGSCMGGGGTCGSLRHHKDPPWRRRSLLLATAPSRRLTPGRPMFYLHHWQADETDFGALSTVIDSGIPLARCQFRLRLGPTSHSAATRFDPSGHRPF